MAKTYKNYKKNNKSKKNKKMRKRRGGSEVSTAMTGLNNPITNVSHKLINFPK